MAPNPRTGPVGCSSANRVSLAGAEAGARRIMNKKRVVLAGGRGFLGRSLAKKLLKRNYEVVVLTHSPHERTDGILEAAWDGKTLGEWIQFVNGAEALVNLAGCS